MTKVARAVEGFTFGCDPEVFLLDGDNNLVSAYGILPGTKYAPYKVDGGAVQVDGMAGEFNTDPAKSFEEFNHNVVSVMQQMKKMLPKGYSLLPKSAVTFPKEIIDVQPHEALELGCEPDYNAWAGGERNPRPEPGDSGLRTASGHIHIGWTNDVDPFNKDHLGHCVDFVKQLDWFLGAPSIKFEDGPERRKLYGRAGAFRPKSYGCEYRVLSNFWIGSIERRRWVWNRLQEAIERMRDQYLPKKYERGNNALVDAINETNIKLFVDKRKELSLPGFRYPMQTLDEYYRIAV